MPLPRVDREPSYKRPVQRGAIEKLIASIYPGAKLRRVSRFGVDEHGEDEATEKGIGYGEPVRIVGVDGEGAPLDLVFHTASADVFGHDRRSDRAAEMLLAFDTFPLVARQARAVDVGAIASDDSFRSLRNCGEFYLISEYQPGRLYADDLREIAHRGSLLDRDVRRTEVLADYLAELHCEKAGTDIEYTRAIRDLVGDGEGIFGIVDGYPPTCGEDLLDRVRGIERSCVGWRWRLRGRHDRCRRTHGDFHPFNLLFDDDRLAVLDAARGCVGDPADDAACIAVNFVFFAIDAPSTWKSAFESMWMDFWNRYLEGTGDSEVLDAAPPFLAWRLLVLANPQWYPALSDEQRGKLLSLAEAALSAGRLDLDMPGALF